MKENRRSRARFQTDISVKVTLLNNPDLWMKGRLASLSAHGLSVILGCELPAGAAVRVEWGSTAFVGELIYCQAHGQEYLAGLKVEEPVYDAQAPQSGKSLR
jgi:hypothetical protein